MVARMVSPRKTEPVSVVFPARVARENFRCDIEPAVGIVRSERFTKLVHTLRGHWELEENPNVKATSSVGVNQQGVESFLCQGISPSFRCDKVPLARHREFVRIMQIDIN